MNKYTIFCSEQQTESALKLGAQLREVFYDVQSPETAKQYNLLIIDSKLYCIPTAEEMINWLEEQRLFIHIDYDFKAKSNPYKCEMSLLNGLTRHCGFFDSRREATLAAIDAALEYLINQKTNKHDE